VRLTNGRYIDFQTTLSHIIKGINEVLVVTGDSADNLPPMLTSMDALPVLSKRFYCGAVAHPLVLDIPRYTQKLERGAKVAHTLLGNEMTVYCQFCIVQATYDRSSADRWLKQAQLLGIGRYV
jgi:5,10-methylenetetrahydrofolate reductase